MDDTRQKRESENGSSVLPTPQFEAALHIVEALRGQGYEAYLAGGCVRDLLLGREPLDYDVATSATPDVVLNMFPRTFAVGAHFGVVLVASETGAGCEQGSVDAALRDRSGDVPFRRSLFRRAPSRCGAVHEDRPGRRAAARFHHQRIAARSGQARPRLGRSNVHRPRSSAGLRRRAGRPRCRA